MASIVDSTRSYEGWLAGQLEIVQPDLEYKWKLMATDAFVCFRGTYYRWLETIGDLAPELDGPAVGVVGDLHVENFGTWRDADGRHVWGVNDFDESEELPYTYDLARLATSAALAIGETKKIRLDPDEAVAAILAGYREGLERGGRPFILAAKHRRLAGMVEQALGDPTRWWAKTLAERDPADGLPAAARPALKAVLPKRGWTYEVATRGGGVGSRGHRRLVLIGDLDGAPTAREVKELAPPASLWLGRPPTPGAEDRPTVVRSPDPMRAVRGGWVARRLAPDCVKLDLGDIRPRADARRLLAWMGAETANIHLGSADIAAVRADLAAREPDWLHDAATRLAEAARRDHKDWRRHSKRL